MSTIMEQLAEALRKIRDRSPTDYGGDVAAMQRDDVENATEALAAYDAQQTDVSSDPAAILVHAYAKAGDSGSVEWEDVNEAHAAARTQLGEKRCVEIDALYCNEDD